MVRHLPQGSRRALLPTSSAQRPDAKRMCRHLTTGRFAELRKASTVQSLHTCCRWAAPRPRSRASNATSEPSHEPSCRRPTRYTTSFHTVELRPHPAAWSSGEGWRQPHPSSAATRAASASEGSQDVRVMSTVDSLTMMEQTPMPVVTAEAIAVSNHSC